METNEDEEGGSKRLGFFCVSEMEGDEWFFIETEGGKGGKSC